MATKHSTDLADRRARAGIGVASKIPLSTPDAASSLQRALRLLAAASPDWQRTGPTDGGEPLHWPAAVAAAQAHIAHALRLMERS